MEKGHVVTWSDVWQYLEDFTTEYKAELRILFFTRPGLRRDAVLEIVCIDLMSASGHQECGRWRYPTPRKEGLNVAAHTMFHLALAVAAMQANPWDMPTLMRRKLVPETD